MDAKTIKKYGRVWWLSMKNFAKISLSSRSGIVIFTISKLLRFALFFIFLFAIFAQTKQIGGYNLWEMILFFLTFNLIDNTVQFLFREVYRFRRNVVEGLFDTVLVQPYPPLVRSLLGGSDIMDIPVLLVTVVCIAITVTHISVPSVIDVIFYISLLINAIIIGLSFHIAVLALGILTTAVDNAIMFYRDLTLMGRIPITIYQEPLRGILTFVIPVGIMMTFPVEALIGTLNPAFILLGFGISFILLFASLSLWHYSLRFYTSASS